MDIVDRRRMARLFANDRHAYLTFLMCEGGLPLKQAFEWGDYAAAMGEVHRIDHAGKRDMVLEMMCCAVLAESCPVPLGSAIAADLVDPKESGASPRADIIEQIAREAMIPNAQVDAWTEVAILWNTRDALVALMRRGLFPSDDAIERWTRSAWQVQRPGVTYPLLDAFTSTWKASNLREAMREVIMPTPGAAFAAAGL